MADPFDTWPRMSIEFTVEMKKESKVAKAIFVERQQDCDFVQVWRETLGDDSNPYRKDAVDFADLATQRFVADSRIGQPYVRSLSDVADHISHNPQCEVAGFVVLKCDWFPDSEVIGICHFRHLMSRKSQTMIQAFGCGLSTHCNKAPETIRPITSVPFY